jgi:hypothetical protein
MVVDPPDPDIFFNFNSYPDPSFHFNADPDLTPHQSDASLRLRIYRPSNSMALKWIRIRLPKIMRIWTLVFLLVAKRFRAPFPFHAVNFLP